MYKQMDKAQRAAQLAALVQQMDVLEAALVPGPFLAGGSMSTADGALAPTFAFITHILPRYFGWEDVFAGRPKLAAWWAAVSADPAAARVLGEVRGGLEGWGASERWSQLGISEQLLDGSFKWRY
jgi:glutathione S-transferase